MAAIVDDQQLCDWVGQDFGLQLTAVETVNFDPDQPAQLWWAQSAAGPAYAVKLSGAGTAAGLVVTDQLAASGVAGIAGPLRTRDGWLWSEQAGNRLSVVPWVGDGRAWTAGLTARQWRAYGQLLARVHATPVTAPLAEALPHESYRPDQFSAAVLALDARIRTSPEPDRHVRALADAWSTAADRLATVRERAEKLGRTLAARPAPNVVCHADPHLGNVLTGVDGRIWLIDWDDAVLAPRERDLMFVLDGLFANQVGAPQREWFFDGYGPVEVDIARLAYYRCTRALEDLTFVAHVLDVERHPESERVRSVEIVREVLGPTGLVGLALASLSELDDLSDGSPDRLSDGSHRR
ncbi:MAG: phosphotransferase [Micromonosporaceae bacterium]